VDSGFYSACAGLAARIRTLELAADNLANLNTAAFRSQQPSFRSLVMTGSGAPTVRAVNSLVAMQEPRLNLSTGQIQHTDNDFDLALEGPGYFAVQTSSGVMYTRNGHFQLSADRTLVNASGDAVLGEGGPLHLPRGQTSVSADGTISVDGALVGRLRVVEFTPGIEPERKGSTYLAVPSGGVSTAKQAIVRQGALEQSNVDPIAEAVGLVALQRHADMMQRALAMFHSELNRVAAEDIPRI
jgi:flagellar basal-body rod protein FlgF